ncbi:MAG: ABC transporter substrate-binding protein [bacterium]
MTIKLLLPLIFIASSLFGFQQSLRDSVNFRADVETLFQDGLNQYRAGRYTTAASVFSRIVLQFPAHQRTTASFLMAAKAYYFTGDYRNSVKHLEQLIARYADSRFTADAYYTLALNYYSQKEYLNAATELLLLENKAADQQLKKKSRQILNSLIAIRLTTKEIRGLIDRAGSDEVRAIFASVLAERLLNMGDAGGAAGLLRSVSSPAENEGAIKQASELLSKIEEGGVAKIGVVLPLMQQNGDRPTNNVGIEMLEGMRLALVQHNEESDTKIAIELRDSRHDTMLVAAQIKEFTAQKNVSAILGPVYSDEVATAAPIAAQAGVPLITPTATSNGLTNLGSTLFQANPDYEVRGRAMAQYAKLILGMSDLAVLAAVDSASSLLTEAFIDEARRLGARIVAVEHYKPDETDLREPILALRKQAWQQLQLTVMNFGSGLRSADVRKLLAWGISRVTLDTLRQKKRILDVEVLFGKNGKRIADSLGIPTEEIRPPRDNMEEPARGIDALFLPLSSPNEMGVITSQLKFYNVRPQLLGSGMWYDLGELDLHRLATNGVIFATDAHWNETDPDYQEFIREYREEFDKRPTRNSLFGYDIMKLALTAMKKNPWNKAVIAATLASGQMFKGLHSRIVFDSSRVNPILTILQYKNRTLVRLGEIDTSKRELIMDENEP